ncbi:MAG TPA: hypothetical protein VJU61_16705, partial [Polyangiaceae bacterium]|nr:hypothetical protein [Polyangiaceae bacterium]
MSVLRPGAVSHSWCMAVLLLLACGEEKPSPRDEMPGLLPGEVELDPNDTGVRGEGQQGDGRGSDPERDVTDLPLDADPRDGAYQALLEAQDQELRLRCGCSFEEFGQASAEECFENLRRPDFAKSCELAAFSLTSQELGPRY